MRVLLAIDGSVSSDAARDLIAGLRWPAGSIVEVVGVTDHTPELFGLPWIPFIEETESVGAELHTRLINALETAERDIARPGVTVDHLTLRGHPAKAIVAEAREFRADLVVVGSRGHGSIGTAFLGSTSAEVVDHAPCPVLIVRSSSVHSVVLAEDGSEGARDAAAILESWPILAGLPTTVVTVAEVGLAAAGPAPGLYDEVLETYTETIEEVRSEHHAVALARAERLRAAGHPAEVVVRDGDPAVQIVEVAETAKADLIVIGTRGHTGIARMLLGSVARSVLTHGHCSVLVCREGVRPEPGSAVATGVGAGS